MGRPPSIGILLTILVVGAVTAGFAASGTVAGAESEGPRATDLGTADRTNNTDTDTLSLEPATARQGQTVTVSAQITNVGDVLDEQAISVFVAGELRDSQQLELGAGDSATVTFTITTAGLAPGNYTVRVQTDDDAGSTTLRIVNATAGTVDEYRDDSGEVTLAGLSRAVDDWAAGKIDISLLSQVVDAWARAESARLVP